MIAAESSCKYIILCDHACTLIIMAAGQVMFYCLNLIIKVCAMNHSAGLSFRRVMVHRIERSQACISGHGSVVSLSV